jgi:FkbM family methyltransferase
VWARRPGTGKHRRFHAWLAEADRLDNERMRLVLASVLRHDSNCIDIGAGTGDILEDITRIAPDGTHIAYEAVPEQIAKLRERFPQVDARHVAVSDTNGQASFVHVPGEAEWSGLRDYQDISGRQTRTLSVATVRLDDDLPPSYVPACVKIDVNGAERQVLEGAVRTLSIHRPVVLLGLPPHTEQPRRRSMTCSPTGAAYASSISSATDRSTGTVSPRPRRRAGTSWRGGEAPAGSARLVPPSLRVATCIWMPPSSRRALNLRRGRLPGTAETEGTATTRKRAPAAPPGVAPTIG